MGGIPRFCLVAATVSPATDAIWLNAFLDGIVELAKGFDVCMIGGDLASAPSDAVASLTIIGEVAPEQICTRRGVLPGDSLLATGVFGDSLATGHHLNFTPRCRESRWLTCHHPIHAMIDSSDGLLIDAARLCRASGVSLELDLNVIPRRTPETTLEAALNDGEDYELLFAVAPELVAGIMSNWPFEAVALHEIGRFVPGASCQVRSTDGRELLAGNSGGYDHVESLGW
jgi:thiamine-monophosphate kinase